MKKTPHCSKRFGICRDTGLCTLLLPSNHLKQCSIPFLFSCFCVCVFFRFILLGFHLYFEFGLVCTFGSVCHHSHHGSFLSLCICSGRAIYTFLIEFGTRLFHYTCIMITSKKIKTLFNHAWWLDTDVIILESAASKKNTTQTFSRASIQIVERLGLRQYRLHSSRVKIQYSSWHVIFWILSFA